MTAFITWAKASGKPHLPASMADVAAFVADMKAMPPDWLATQLRAVDEEHERLGYAPPCRSTLVTELINKLYPIDPPRSWQAEMKDAFRRLPLLLQLYVAAHEKRREKEIRRAQNEAAELRQKLAEYERKPDEAFSQVAKAG